MANGKTEGAFDEVITKLKEANKAIELHKANVAKLNADAKQSVDERQTEFMKSYNAAIVSFMNVGKELDRVIKEEKNLIWRDKEQFIKKIFK